MDTFLHRIFDYPGSNLDTLDVLVIPTDGGIFTEYWLVTAIPFMDINVPFSCAIAAIYYPTIV